MQKLVPNGLLIGSIGLLLLLVSQANQSMGLELDESIDNMSVGIRKFNEWLEKEFPPSDINDLDKIHEWVMDKRKSFFIDKKLKWAIDVMVAIKAARDCSPDVLLILEKVQPAITFGTFPASNTKLQFFERAFRRRAREFLDFCVFRSYWYNHGPIGESRRLVFEEFGVEIRRRDDRIMEARREEARRKKAKSNGETTIYQSTNTMIIGETIIYQSTNTMIMNALEQLELRAYVEALEDPSAEYEATREVMDGAREYCSTVMREYKKNMNRYFDQCPEFISLFGEKFGLLDRALSVVEILSPQLPSIEFVLKARDHNYLAKLFWQKLCSTVKGIYESRLLSLEDC